MPDTLGINPKRVKFYDKCACGRVTIYYNKKFFPKTHTFQAEYQDAIAPNLDLTKILRKNPG